MIADRFPELKNLTSDEQLELASELAKSALHAGDSLGLTDEAVSALESRLSYFVDNPESGTSWESLKTKKDA